MQKFILIRGHQGRENRRLPNKKPPNLKRSIRMRKLSVLKTICLLPMNTVNIVGRAKQWIRAQKRGNA